MSEIRISLDFRHSFLSDIGTLKKLNGNWTLDFRHWSKKGYIVVKHNTTFNAILLSPDEVQISTGNQNTVDVWNKDVWNLNCFACISDRFVQCLKIKHICLDFRHILKKDVSKNQTFENWIRSVVECLKSILVRISETVKAKTVDVWNPNFCEFRFQTLSKNKLFGNQTVFECPKSILVCISDTYCTAIWRVKKHL